MDFLVQEDQKRLVKQLGILFIVSFIFSLFFTNTIKDVTMGSILFSLFIFSLLLYPILFIRSWVRTPPTTLLVKAFIHLITLPSIIYYVLLGVVFIQYLFAAFSIEALIVTLLIFLVAGYLIYFYTKFIKGTP